MCFLVVEQSSAFGGWVVTLACFYNVRGVLPEAINIASTMKHRNSVPRAEPRIGPCWAIMHRDSPCAPLRRAEGVRCPYVQMDCLYRS